MNILRDPAKAGSRKEELRRREQSKRVAKLSFIFVKSFRKMGRKEL